MAEQKEVSIVNNECFRTDYPVGAIISIEGVNCEVVEDIDLSDGNLYDENCCECILKGKKEGIMCVNLACLDIHRKDRKDVHFVKIESHE